MSNLREYNRRTDPHIADTDGDGMPDGWEVRYGLDPRADDAEEDADDDGLSNLAEYVQGSDPTSVPGSPSSGDDEVVAMVGVVVALGPLADDLEYRRGALLAQPWRLLTAHLVHIDVVHGAMNVLALAAIGLPLTRMLGWVRMLLLFSGCAVGVSLARLAFDSAIIWYRGLSGVLHGLAGCWLWLLRTSSPAVASLGLAAIAAKIVWENLPGPVSGIVPTVLQAHGYGFVIGLLFGAALDRARAAPKPVTR